MNNNNNKKRAFVSRIEVTANSTLVQQQNGRKCILVCNFGLCTLAHFKIEMTAAVAGIAVATTYNRFQMTEKDTHIHTHNS